ncbi:MAG: 2OG-Fe(II) oxygenase [Gammaproteobacteria bacterium]|nr:2OG-Fe(II) oxygenase [Gammaproteobacteria bacterium]
MTNIHLDAAARFDDAGDHDEAVNVLARGTRAGDLTAMTTLGKRLLVGDRAPYLPKDGAGMVLEAARKGQPEAMAQVAVFQCTGVFQPKDWPQAFKTLTWAARLGWQPARMQLLLFSGRKSEAEQTLGREEAFWQQLGESLDVTALLTVPAVEPLNFAPVVNAFRSFLTADFCATLIAQSARRLKPALVYDPVNKQDIRSVTRTNSIAQFNLVENEVMHFLLQERISRAAGVPMVQLEATAILHYQPGEEISNHYDFVSPDLPDYDQEISENGQRIITFLIYLNHEYEGGETFFPSMGLAFKGNTGDAMYFVNALEDGSPDLRTLHAGRPPTAGEKWIVSQFIRNRPVKYVL